MSTARCLDCAFEGTVEQIRTHRADKHAARPRMAAPQTFRERYEEMRSRRLVATDLFLPSEVAELFRVDPKTVTRWAAVGRLPCVRTMGGHRRFRAADVEALFEREGL